MDNTNKIGSETTVNRNLAAMLSSEIVEKNGVKYLRGSYGLLLKKPYDVYYNEAMSILKMLLKNFPELSYYIQTLTPIFSSIIDTFCTGHGFIAINPEFWDKLVEQSERMGRNKWELCLFVYLHEIYHQIFNHVKDGITYKDAYPDHNMQNRAMDYSINPLIEKFYGLSGATKDACGLIKDEFEGKTWTEIYAILQELGSEDEANKEPWQVIKNAKSKVKMEDINDNNNNDDIKIYDDPDKDTSTGEKKNRIKLEYSKDYKDGYASQKPIILSIYKDVLDNGGSLEDLRDALIQYAQSKGMDIFESASPVNMDDWNAGAESAWANAIKTVNAKLKALQRGDGDDTKQRDDIKSDELDDAFDDLNDTLSNAGSGEDDSDEENENENGNGDSSDDETSNEDGDNSQMDGGSGSSSSDSSDDENQIGGGGNNSSNNNEDGSDGNGEGRDGNEKELAEDIADELNDMSDDEKIMSILNARGEEPKDEEPNPEELAKSIEEHMDKIEDYLEKKGDKDAAEKAKNLKNGAKKMLGIEQHKSEIDWREIFSEFLSETATVTYEDIDLDSLIGVDNMSGGIIDYETKFKTEDAMNHIVIGLDNSGSVFGVGNIPAFLGELVHVLDKGVDEDCVVDFIQFEDGITNCTRIVHNEGESLNEVKQVSSAMGGGTDYKETMRQMHIMMDLWDDDRSGLRPEFQDTVATKKDGSEVVIAPATCAIIFTDTDLSWGSKFYDIDVDKLLIFVIGGRKGFRLQGQDAMFNPCIRLLDDASQWNYGTAFVKESFFDDAGSYDDIDKNNAEASVVDVDYLKTVANDIQTELRSRDVNVNVKVSENGVVIEGNIVINGFYMSMGDAVIDGDVKIINCTDKILKYLPKDINGSLILCKCDISDEALEQIIDKYGKDKVYYAEFRGKNSNLPSLNAAFIIDYYMRNSTLRNKFVIKDIEGLTKDKRYKSLLKTVVLPNVREDVEEDALQKLFVKNLFIDNDIVDVLVTIEAVSGQRMITLDGSDFYIDGYPSNNNFPEFFKIRLSNSSLTLKDVNFNSITSLPREMKKGTCVIIRVYGTNAKTRELATEYRKIHNESKDLAKFLVSVI